MMWLYNFIKELDEIKDVNGEEQKVVIMSEFNQVAFILKLVRGKSWDTSRDLQTKAA